MGAPGIEEASARSETMLIANIASMSPTIHAIDGQGVGAVALTALGDEFPPNLLK